MLHQMPIHEFMSTLASDAPAPGGGSASALAGAMAAALVDMVCQLSLKRAELESRGPVFRRISGEAAALREELLALIDKDATAFDAVMAAFKMPKGNDEEKAIRSAAIQKAYAGAIEIPLRTAACCVAVAGCASELAEGFNTNASSDLASAAACARAGMQGGLSNVRINLPSIKDPQFKNRVEDDVTRLETTMASHVTRINELLQ